MLAEIRKGSIERLRRAGDLYQDQLNDWTDLAKTEESVQREYEGRYLFELIQNADDVLVEWLDQQGRKDQVKGQRRVRIQLTPDSLIVANDGLPFLEDNIRALCRIHKTTKSASKQIGHKGIGFKSVLKISQTPQIFSGDFAFKFDRELFVNRVLDILGKEKLDQLLPIFKAPFDTQLSELSDSEKRIVQEILDEGFVTVIRLPFDAEVRITDIEKQIESDIKPELLLFLNAVEQIEVKIESKKKRVFSRETLDQNQVYSEVGLFEFQAGIGNKLISRWLHVCSEKIPVKEKSLVKGLGEAWQSIDYLRSSIAFPLTLDGKSLNLFHDSQRFYVYFPTDEFSGLSFLVNADLYLKSSREEISLNGLNEYLITQIVSLIANQAVKALKHKFPNSSTIVEALAPLSNKPERDFPKRFFEAYMAQLRHTAFVPINAEEYRSPKEIRFMPDHVDKIGFRRFFAPTSFCQDEPFWFPTVEVQTLEENLRGDGKPSFLTHDLINVEKLDFGCLKDVLQRKFLDEINRTDQGEFFRFLAAWWEQIPYYKYRFVNILKKTPIIPTSSGWRNPEETVIFQTNLRGKDDFKTPSGFGFEVVPIEVYGENPSYDGVIANFLKELGVREYSSRAIIQSAILPKLIDESTFNDLLENHSQGVLLAYCLLFEYLEEEKSIGEMSGKLGKVPVPAYCLTDSKKVVWKPADEVYFSKDWVGQEALEQLLVGVDEVYFLHTSLFEFDLSGSQPDQENWRKFYSVLGVRDHLRVIRTFSYQNGYHQLFYSKIGSGKHYWKQYLKGFWEEFQCSTYHRRREPTRELHEIYSIEHFDEIIDQKSFEKSRILLKHLSVHWDYYRKYLSSTLRCSIKSCQSEVEILSYLGYCLQELAWIPGEVANGSVKAFFSAQEIWIMNASVPHEVHHLLPTLPDTIFETLDKSFIREVFPINRQLADYIELLRVIPEKYPISECSSDQVEAVHNLFTWVCEVIQNNLFDLGTNNYPEVPADLKILALREDRFEFVDVGEKLLVVSDENSMLSNEWQETLWFAQLEKSMSSIKTWLGLRPISELIDVEAIPGEPLLEKTKQYSIRIRQLFPYLLAIVRDRQFSKYDDILKRLARLKVHCVNDLRVLQKCRIPNIDSKTESLPVFLDIRNEEIEGTIIKRRHGDLYINPNAPDAFWHFGEAIAKYIDIGGIADAFTVLWKLEKSEDRMAFLKSKNIEEATLDRVRQDLEEILQGKNDDEVFPGYDFYSDGYDTGQNHDEISFSPQDTEITSEVDVRRTPGGGDSAPLHPVGVTRSSGASSHTKSAMPRKPKGRMKSYVVPDSSDELPESSNSHGSSSDPETDRQGIIRVLAYERKHDRRPTELPHNNPGYDIESKDRNGKMRFIEVKSLSERWGEGNAPALTRNEFEFAREKKQDYWLYVVECSQLDDFARIYIIQDPARRIDQYLFDDGWQNVAKPD